MGSQSAISISLSLNFNSGEWIGGGARGPSDLATACEKVSGGATLAEVAKDHPSAFVRNYKGLAVLRSLLRPVTANWVGTRCVFWLYGPTGTGKSRTAFEYGGLPYEPIRAGRGTVWWDGYTGQDVVLFDDLREGQVQIADFLRWTDGRAFVGPIKGGTVGVEAHTWFVTSNYPPSRIWPGEDLSPVDRRCKVIYLNGGPCDAQMRENIKCGHGHAVEPGNTIPVQRPAAAEGAEPVSSPPVSKRTPKDLAMLLEAVESGMFKACGTHGIEECPVCEDWDNLQ